MKRPVHYTEPQRGSDGLLHSAIKTDQSQPSPVSRCPEFHNIDRCIDGFKNGFPDTTIKIYTL